jgi:hypothetical protein
MASHEHQEYTGSRDQSVLSQRYVNLVINLPSACLGGTGGTSCKGAFWAVVACLVGSALPPESPGKPYGNNISNCLLRSVEVNIATVKSLGKPSTGNWAADRMFKREKEFQRISIFIDISTMFALYPIGWFVLRLFAVRSSQFAVRSSQFAVRNTQSILERLDSD